MKSTRKTAAVAAAALLASVAVATTARAAAGCQVDYRVSSQWAGGFTAAITIKNLGDPINGWQLAWALPAGQTITQAWGFTASGAVVATNASYNAAIGTGGSVEVGFNGTWTGSNPVPTAFTLNGTACTGSTTPPTTAPPATTAPPTTTPPTTTPPSTTPPTTTPPGGPVKAFPTAVGFGAAATGGRGGTVYHVTNLNDSGAGSFRDAVGANNRIVVFDVGGYIKLSSTVLVKSNITIAGQTAPGAGIGVQGGEVSFNSAANVIVRNFRFRMGTEDADQKNNGVNWLDASNLIFDHVSIEFGAWNNIDAVRASNITMQYSIDANPIGQQFGAHTETGPYTWWRNLWANSHNRNPLAKANTQFVNNVVYNYQAGYTAGNSSGHFLHDVVGNYFITGPRTTSASNYYYQTGNQQIYNRDNWVDSNKDGRLNGSAAVVRGGATELTAPFSADTARIPTVAAAAAYPDVIAKAGALPRDDVDKLVVADVTSLGTKGNLWASQTATGLTNNGYGTLPGAAAKPDGDRDGMPDAWETTYGLNLSVNDANGDFDKTGYTNIEKYVNGLLDGQYP
ncbi:cellulose binding domain-containing protein [Paractinoplanes lichenicola]|uniref:Cellulose binding domain-containing protein n=1 Tax=Paractinoplanes lichenicola TaxID=2802976 RepID=A0ABS1VUC8_9ACTN|nr:cellulose binding domain-containing protein [Actinoplanes lichenicola]MBL7258061.1 cellulose binding domain-containing protein [Actinoplanes lichenicola]